MKITSNHDEIAQQFAITEKQFDHEVRSVIRRTAVAMQARIRKNASTGYHNRLKSKQRGHIPGTGPGPNVATGNYRRSIQVTHTREGTQHTSIIHTNAPQARRLEYGFRGQDSLGRTFNQPPYPHWQPVVQEQTEFLRQEIARSIRTIVSGKRTPNVPE